MLELGPMGARGPARDAEPHPPERCRRGSEPGPDGPVFSLSIPVDENGPADRRLRPLQPDPPDDPRRQRRGHRARTVRDFYGGRDRWIRGTDDLLILPLQSGTQWDSLAHIVFDNRIYNGYDATTVGSKGAIATTSPTLATESSAGASCWTSRGARVVAWLEPGDQIHADDLEACARRRASTVGRGDIVLVRTGQMAQCRAAGTWGTYAGGSAPGLALDAARWIFDRELAAVAADTWGLEVLPNQTADVFQPLHIILIVHMGLLVGEIFDLEALADDCARTARYEFLFTAPPLPITGGVGSPVNPIAIK